MHSARLSRDDPPFEREVESQQRVRSRSCGPRAGMLFPGIGELCNGRQREGAVMIGLGIAELGAFVAGGIKQGFGSTAALLPVLTFGDLLTASAMDAGLEVQRAAGLPYVPGESLTELAAAPFSGEVMGRPAVYAGIAGTVALSLLYGRLVDGPIATDSFRQRPRLFGRDVNSSWGYPAGLAIGVGVFEHVALAEETAFRGVLQSGLARRYGETEGLVFSSLIFGLVHSTNIFFIDNSTDRIHYLLYDVPFITLLGGYLGYIYRDSGYSLAPSVAVHFWYDFLISAVGFVLDPKNSPLAFTTAAAF